MTDCSRLMEKFFLYKSVLSTGRGHKSSPGQDCSDAYIVQPPPTSPLCRKRNENNSNMNTQVGKAT